VERKDVGMSSNAEGLERRSVLERVLSLFADVRQGEGFTGLLLMSNVFILLTSYYIIKPVRESLILSANGAEIKSYTGALQALLFLLIVPLYGAFANRVNRLRLINGVTAFFLSNLVIFYMLGQLKVPIAIPFFVWVGLFNLMLLAQVWAFANDIYTPEQGRRMFAIIGIGSSFGAIFGALLAGKLFAPLGPYRMMLVSASLLLLCMGLTTWIHHREKSRPVDRAKPKKVDPPIRGKGGFQMVLRHRYLLLIAVMVLLANLVNTTGEFILGKTVTMHAETLASTGPADFTQQGYIGQFYANFYFWVNFVGALLQLFFVSRILKFAGIGSALLILPFIALGSYALLAFAPVLSLVRIVKIAENSADYSIQNTARQALFLRTSRNAKYKAKTAIDNFFWRSGDALSGLLVFMGTQLRFGLGGFAVANIILVVAWLMIVVHIVHIRMAWARQATLPAGRRQRNVAPAV
jgi:ATP:ADP antiporter, AAA family